MKLRVIENTPSDYYPFGSVAKGRSFSSTAYRYGFNTQEKTDEVAGAGNHTTAEYWEYDTRLGRRWNLDPIRQTSQSDYACFSDNPIWKVDPDGDDDFFNSQGKFLYADDKKSRTIIIVNDKGVQTQLKDYTFTKDNAKTLASIGNHYAPSANLDVSKLGGGSLSVSERGWTANNSGQVDVKSTSLYNQGGVGSGSDIMNHNDKTNRISFTVEKGKISPLLNDANNMISVLGHEKTHGDFTTNDGFEHLNVYYEQINSPNFKSTTKEFKESVYSNIREIVTTAMGYNDKALSKDQIQSIRKEGANWQEKFKKAGGVYSKDKQK